ncbi:MAG: hypothetical protein ACXAE3_09535 [Candidatus Kariarchaeaceae archaeon]|jgi:predicted nucleic acid-binding Zn finger protein
MDKAQDLLREKKVFRLKTDKDYLSDYFVVTGTQEMDYLVVMPDFCSCRHFQINCIKTPGKICKHLLACRLGSTKVPSKSFPDWQKLLLED